MAPAAPLLAGYAFPPLQAAVAGGLSALATMLVSAATGGSASLLSPGWSWLWHPWSGATTVDAALRTVADPGVLVVVAAWAIAGATCSALCGRSSRGAAVLGVALGIAVIAGGYALWGAIGNGTAPLASAAVDLGISAVLMIAVVALGPPPQPRDV